MTIGQLQIGNRQVGPGWPVFVIAEVAQAHDGSLGMAHAFVEMVAKAGADAIKFQTHIAAAESSPDEPWRVQFSQQDVSRYDYWRRMEFTEDQWRGLKRHAAERGLIFLSSPFSIRAVELLARLDVPAWKVASGEVNNPLLLERMAAARRPMLLSSGMSTHAELNAAVALLRRQQIQLGVFQCTTAYPCPPERLGLDQIGALRDRHACPVGLSDHSGTIYAGLAAAALGADMVEVHVTMSRDMFGPDVSASVTGDELRQLVTGCQFIRRALACPTDKDAVAGELQQARRTFGKSLVAAHDLTCGTVLCRAHLDARKPGTGIPANQLDRVLGRRLRRDVAAGTQLATDHWQDAAAPPAAVGRSGGIPQAERSGTA
ncbi:MAG: N-acetylneuraminate synthase [Planctomycetes bacterium RBG_16_64_10]|nr:MAG: N-acetylneuraminate synthase [Planctomycetes bacterium RBG_16_64_10]